MKTKNRIRMIGGAIAVIAAILLLSGLIGGKRLMYHIRNRAAMGLEPLAKADVVQKTVDTPEATGADGTITADDWTRDYPYIVASMRANSDNDEIVDYLEQDPYLVNIYQGYGFAKDYGSARGHEYTLEDVADTQRPHPKANCLTCKTPNFAKLVQDEGVGVYSRPFEEVMSQMQENISCYTCHGNRAGEAGTLEVTHTYVNKALGDAVTSIDPATLSCGQCHIEYYFTPSDSETMMPYHSVADMTPEAILAYYDAMEYQVKKEVDGQEVLVDVKGFYDWEQPGTGTRMLKAQHPEMETYLHGIHATQGMNCADCHMPIEMAEDGTVYHSHLLVSPLDNESLLESCAQCHGDTDMVAFVRRVQDRVTERETEVGNKLSGLKDTLTQAVEAEAFSDAELEELRRLHREAQWYFDFCYVENSEGAHNSSLSMGCLETSEAKIDEAMALLKARGFGA